MGEPKPGGSIRILPPDIARRIAAGEVIDRPFSVVRELLDNSLDADASTITVRLSGGGLDTITVADDGAGMSADDLEICYHSHATSKINDIEDLSTVRTLGFRGEALSSIGAVAELSIISSPDDSGLGHELHVRGNRRILFQSTRAARGSTVTVRELFFNLPARKKFVKSASAESNLCRTAFLEKAVPHPETAFRLFSGDELKLFLPPADLVSRVADSHSRLIDKAVLHYVKGSGAGAQIEAVVGDPSVSRSDRRLVQIYVNGRRISEYAFVQAVEYAYDQFLPGGRFPIAFVFMNIDPSLVDFNVHPAKKEARFQNRSELRSRIVDLVRGFLAAFERKSLTEGVEHAAPSLGFLDSPAPDRPDHDRRTTGRDGSWRASQESRTAPVGYPRGDRGLVHEDSPVFSPAEALPPSGGLRYLGQVFDLFLLAELDARLYIVDQHAAHERIIFERAREKKGSQELLIPIVLEVSESQDVALAEMGGKLEVLGFAVSREGERRWEVSGVPAAAADLPEAVLRETLESVDSLEYEAWEWEFYAEIACKAAIKDGATLDSVTARELLREAFALPHPRCPHGRPLWFEISRDELFSLVGRT